MYKKIYFAIGIFFIGIASLQSQNHIDALRYSQQFYSSTAKAEAMGNSLSAVGADFSSFMINPAGIAVYKGKQFTFTPNFIISKTDGSFSGTETYDGRIGFNFSNFAYVNSKETGGILKSVNWGFSYNSYNDFREQTYVSAKNQSGSLLDFIVYNSNNDRYSTFREDLAWRAWLIDYDNVAQEYWSFVTDDARYGLTQSKEIRTNGGAGEYSFSLGANINDMLYVGGTFGLTSVNYKYESSYTETNFPLIYVDNPLIIGDSILANPNKINFKENLTTEGSGFNAKIGFIFQPLKFLRIGGAVHTPTSYVFNEDYQVSMYVDYPVADEAGYSNYEPDTANYFEWRLKTPMRANIGLALILDSYQIGKFYTVPMTFSIDYEYVDYSSARMRTDTYDDFYYDFSDENTDINTLFKETHNIRAGAEINFGSIKLRGGYAIYSSPYNADGEIYAKSVYSGGIGFASEHSFVDFSYSYSPVNKTLYLYNANDIYPNNPIGGLLEPQADLSISKQFVKLTFGVKF